MKYLFIILITLCSSQIHASTLALEFDNSAQETEFLEIIHNLRCLVCQNQSIAESNAPLANDLKIRVYEMLKQGQSENTIKAYMKQRYGDFVLYKPELNSHTVLLWITPGFLLILAVLAVWKLKLFNKRLPDPKLLIEQKASDSPIVGYSPSTSPVNNSHWITWIVVIFIPVSSVILYLHLGDPEAAQKQQLQKTAMTIKSAIPQLVQYLSEHPEDTHAWIRLEQAYRFLHQDDLAEQIKRRMHALDPEQFPDSTIAKP